jgi:hemoglobin-like flavoprotein/ferredoxin-NADP reductase
MLTETQRSIIRATIPALQDQGETITQHFYKTLFNAHPELLNIFNKANQRPGGQSANLATSILMYAGNIDHLDKLSAMVERIAHKHGSVEVKPEHYPVVGHHLLLSIHAALGDTATDDVLDAWGAAYVDLAAIFIGREKELYDSGARCAGGWYGFKEFRVSQKVRESSTIVSFHLVPKDGSTLPEFLPGQFLSIKLKTPQDPNEQIRQYSLSCASNGTYYRISVGREKAGSNNILVPDGIVSNFLQDHAEEGDSLQVHMPLGDFVLDKRSSRPVVLLSGGVGITPVLSMFDYLVTNSDRPVTFLHGTGSRLEHSFGHEIRDLASLRSNTKAVVFYVEVDTADASNPNNTIIVSPDNRSRQQINEAVRGELIKTGALAEDGRHFLTLSHRSDMTGPDRTWAAMYRPGDVVQYERGSKAEGIERGSIGVVRSNDATMNRVTVELSNGSRVEYDPKRIYGVNVYRETSREFATGDRLQFAALNKELGISNRDMGTITKMEADRLTVLMDGKEKRSVSFKPSEFRQFDHGYAVTSHSSQGLTADRVIANIDTDSSRSLINNRLAYVAISRASQDARIYTNNAETLGQRLATDVTKTATLDFGEISVLVVLRTRLIVTSFLHGLGHRSCRSPMAFYQLYCSCGSGSLCIWHCPDQRTHTLRASNVSPCPRGRQ